MTTDNDNGFDGYHGQEPEEGAHWVKLVQAQSGEANGEDPVSKAGMFFNTSNGESYESMTLVPLHSMSTMVNFPEGASGPVCQSDDGIRPSDYVKVPVSPECHGCRSAKWLRGKAECKPGYLVIAFHVEGERPVKLRIKGTTVKSWKKFYDLCVAIDGVSAFHQVTTTVTSRYEDKGTFKYWSLQLSKPEKHDGDYAAIADELRPVESSGNGPDDEDGQEIPF